MKHSHLCFLTSHSAIHFLVPCPSFLLTISKSPFLHPAMNGKAPQGSAPASLSCCHIHYHSYSKLWFLLIHTGALICTPNIYTEEAPLNLQFGITKVLHNSIKSQKIDIYFSKPTVLPSLNSFVSNSFMPLCCVTQEAWNHLEHQVSKYPGLIAIMIGFSPSQLLTSLSKPSSSLVQRLLLPPKWFSTIFQFIFHNSHSHLFTLQWLYLRMKFQVFISIL